MAQLSNQRERFWTFKINLTIPVWETARATSTKQIKPVLGYVTHTSLGKNLGETNICTSRMVFPASLFSKATYKCKVLKGGTPGIHPTSPIQVVSQC